MFRVLSWSSHKSKRPVQSTAGAEILTACEAINEGKTLKRAFSTLTGRPVQLIVLVHFRDLYTSLSTRCNSIDKSMGTDVKCIRFEYNVGNVDVILWLYVSVNFAELELKLIPLRAKHCSS